MAVNSVSQTGEKIEEAGLDNKKGFCSERNGLNMYKARQ